MGAGTALSEAGPVEGRYSVEKERVSLPLLGLVRACDARRREFGV